MDEQQKPSFYQRHKRGFKTAGITLVTVGLAALAVFGIQKMNLKSEDEESSTDTDNFSNIMTTVLSIVPDNPIIQDPVVTYEKESFPVSAHYRNLPEGWHSSPEKQAEADRRGIHLPEGKTYVDTYEKHTA